MKKRLSVFLLVFVLLLQLLPAGVMASDEIGIMDPMYDDPMYARYAEEVTEEAPVLFAEEGSEEETQSEAQKDTRVTFDDFSTRALQDGETLHKGVDVSYYQGTIDWVAAKADGVEFAIIRGGYRGWGDAGNLKEDPYFDTYMRNALEAGVEVGVYIYSQATTVKEAQEEAQFLIDMVKDYDITLPLVLDFEFASNGVGRLWQAYKDGKLDKTSAAQVCQAFCDTVEAAGYDSMVYVNPDMAKNYLDVTNLERIWLAHYTGTDEKYRDEETGKFPASYYAGEYEFWQCASKGKVAGISGNVDINFWFRPQPPREPFKDVVSTDWFYEDVVYAYENKITEGVTNTSFAPNSNTTRGQLVTMLYRMVGEPEVTGESSFTDLTAEYYKDAVLWAYQNGIVNGRSDTEFDPDSDVTRQELATILYRYATGLSGADQTDAAEEDALAAFTDTDKVASYAKAPIIWAVEHGIINGMTETTLEPTGNATRAQIVAVIHRYMVLLQEQDTALQEKILGMTFDDSILLGLEGTEEALRTLMQGVLEGTVMDKETDDVVAGVANGMYIFLQENFLLAEEFLTADTWTLSADIKANYYLTAAWGEGETTQSLKYDGENVSLAAE